MNKEIPKIRVYTGLSIESKCNQQKHPLNETFAAIAAVDAEESSEHYTNSPDFVSAIFWYAKKKNVTFEFFLDGVSHETNLEPLFANFNLALDLIRELCKDVTDE